MHHTRWVIQIVWIDVSTSSKKYRNIHSHIILPNCCFWYVWLMSNQGLLCLHSFHQCDWILCICLLMDDTIQWIDCLYNIFCKIFFLYKKKNVFHYCVLFMHDVYRLVVICIIYIHILYILLCRIMIKIFYFIQLFGWWYAYRMNWYLNIFFFFLQVWVKTTL